ERHATLAIPLATRDLRTAETAGRVHADALHAELHRRLNRLLHRAAERHAALELRRDVLGDEVGVGLGLADFLDVHEELVVRRALQRLLELLDARTALTDQDAGARGVDDDLDLVRRTLDLDVRDAGVRDLLRGEELLDALLQLDVLMQP